jgi:hypothetical protein
MSGDKLAPEHHKLLENWGKTYIIFRHWKKGKAHELDTMCAISHLPFFIPGNTFPKQVEQDLESKQNAAVYQSTSLYLQKVLEFRGNRDE